MFANLESALSDVGTLGPAHVHEGIAGENGGVAFGLDVAANADMTGGRFGATSQLTPDDVDTLDTGGFNVNLHTEDHGGGEIRGQFEPF